MGILIHTSFVTSQGFSVSSVYGRIGRMTFDPSGNGDYAITVSLLTYVDRQRRLEGKNTVPIPGLSDLVSFTGVLGDMDSIYGLLKSELTARGLTLEDVLETAPEPAPAPEPTPEPAPAPVDEVSPQSSEPTQ
jgi:hypothetical protein